MRPRFEVPLQSTYHKPLGFPVTLECTVRGRPKPNVQWFHNGVLIEPSYMPVYKITLLSDKSMLHITEMMPATEGRYVCKAVNEAGEKTTECILHAGEPEEHKPEEFHPPQEEKSHKVPAFLQSKQPRRKPSDDEYQSFESESELSFKETIVPQIRKLSRPKESPPPEKPEKTAFQTAKESAIEFLTTVLKPTWPFSMFCSASPKEAPKEEEEPAEPERPPPRLPERLPSAERPPRPERPPSAEKTRPGRPPRAEPPRPLRPGELAERPPVTEPVQRKEPPRPESPWFLEPTEPYPTERPPSVETDRLAPRDARKPPSGRRTPEAPERMPPEEFGSEHLNLECLPSSLLHWKTSKSLWDTLQRKEVNIAHSPVTQLELATMLSYDF
ncbi:uncharacterized protein [Dermacentor albipictus]|uniref:uncharacterized protein n=1 Tax=Dermacentor albipictus TaxID=60249 RepID=UPI0038FD0382